MLAAWLLLCLDAAFHPNPYIAPMLISDSHEFIFLRMRKAASTSMQEILRPYCITPPPGKFAHLKSRSRLEWNYQRYVPRMHESILAVKRLMPAELFSRYFKFAFVRNPWERLVSEYEYILKRQQHGRHARVKSLAGFTEFIHMQIPRSDAYQVNMLCDENGDLLMDFVGKLENLDDDWRTVCERIGIPYQALPQRNVTQHRRYEEYFDQNSIELVARHWAKEIDLFEYSFNL